MFPLKFLVDHIQILSKSFEQNDHVTLSCDVIPPQLELFADEKQISQILINLVKNAFQALANTPDAQVKITAKTGENGRPEICVCDNGPGISENILDKIFIPFFTTKENGSGIGLSISRQIIQMHGGSLKITSTPGKTIAILNF